MSDLEILFEDHDSSDVEEIDCATPLLSGSHITSETGRIDGIRIGVLVGMAEDGTRPLVIYPGRRSTAAVSARSVLDLHGAHIGREVVLMFEDGDPALPVIMGCMPAKAGWPENARPANLEVESDGERLLVAGKSQLVLRCGKASITLTAAGKVLVQGEYIATCSAGTTRIKGGSVQIN